MKALIKTKTGTDLREVPSPTLQSPNEVLIQVSVSALCRTDLYVAEGKIPVSEGRILGHEFSGRVVEVGEEISHLAPGDFVTAMPIIPCGICSECKRSSVQTCQSATMLGVERDGAFAEYVVVPANSVLKLPEHLTPFQGAYGEPIAATLGLLHADILPQQYGAILGDNRIAELSLRVLKAVGFENLTRYRNKQDEGTSKVTTRGINPLSTARSGLRESEKIVAKTEKS